jgi:hypothetical protein
MLKKTKKFVFWAMIGLFALLVLLVAVRLEIRLDVSKVLYAIGALVLISGLWMLIRYLIKPDRTVRLVTSVTLESPPRILSSVKNHKLHIRCEKHVEEKGKSEIIKMDEVVMTFNKKDHPDIQSYSMSLVKDFLNNQQASLSEQYPDAKLHISPFSLERSNPPALDA